MFKLKITARRLWISGAAFASLTATAMIVAFPAVGSGPPSALSQLAALQTAASPGAVPAAATVPSAVANLVPHLPDPSGSQGTAIANDVRTLMHNEGRGGADVFAYPTSTGSVCMVVNDRIPAATCVDHFDRQSLPVAADVYSLRGSSPTVAGLAPDDVASVGVIVNGGAQAAALAHNAFYFQTALGTPDSAITAIVVHFKDGTSTTQSFTLKPPPFS